MKTSSEARIAASERIGGFESCHPSAPTIGRNPGSIRKRDSLSWPHQPARRGRSCCIPCRSWTKQPPTEPGPEFRYLYVHHTAKSTYKYLNSGPGSVGGCFV